MKDRRNLPGEVLARLAGAGFGDVGCVQRGVRLEDRRSPLEIRAAADGALRLVGYATTWEQGYDVYGGPPWGWNEVMAEGSWDRTLAEQDDIRLLLNHEGMPLARTKSGTLTLISDDLGLLVEASLDVASPLVAQVRSAMERGDLDQMSCAFVVLRQEWSPDFDTRRILEVKGFDVSVVTYPANEATMALVGASAARAERSTNTRSLAMARAELDLIAAR